MALFCSGFEHLESEWIFSMYPAGRHLTNTKVSFETAVRSHFLSALFYGADDGFIRKAECWLQVRCLGFRILIFGFHIWVFGLWISDLRFSFLDSRFYDLDLRSAKIDVGYCPWKCVSRFMECFSRTMVLQSFIFVTVVLGGYWLTVFFIESF